MEAVLSKVLSPGVAELLKMCLALSMGVIPTSPSSAAERSAGTAGNRSHGEQSAGVCCAESCFVSPALSAARIGVLIQL